MTRLNLDKPGVCLTYKATLLTAAIIFISIIPVAGAQSIVPPVSQLTAKSRACKMPASFTVMDASVSYEGKAVTGGKAVDRRNAYRPIDFDGDGVCEVLAETCNAKTGVRKGDALFCPETWQLPLKYKSGRWYTAWDIGNGGGGERWRGTVTFLYFERNTKELKVSAFHNFFAHTTASPALVVTLSKTRGDTAEPAAEQVRQIAYDVYSQEGPAQQGGVLREFLEMHANRIMDEYEWRLQHCGKPNGFHDPDGQSAQLGDLEEILRQLLANVIYPVQGQARQAGGSGAHSPWQERIQQLLEVRSREALEACKRTGGYKDVVNYVE